ncbi:HAD domain-containing protein [Virgisporangium ochraceum]
MTRPFVFLDVDGVLIPFRPRPDSPPSGGTDVGNPLLHRLNPDDGPRLLALDGDLVWATTWMADANDAVAPPLGLPALPVVEWPDEDDDEPGVHWKTVCPTRWAAGRAFVWLDDESTDADRRWVAAHHPAPALLHRVDPTVGLTDADFAAVRRWLALPGGAG